LSQVAKHCVRHSFHCQYSLTRYSYPANRHGDRTVAQQYPIGVKQQHVTDTQENENDLPCRTKQTHGAIVNLGKVRRANNQSKPISGKNVENDNQDKLNDCESRLKCRSKCRTILIWIGITILVTTVATTGIVFGLTRLFPIQQHLM
jgi:hypothetical protein